MIKSVRLEVPEVTVQMGQSPNTDRESSHATHMVNEQGAWSRGCSCQI